jgi:putative alpha-1,2-mannosidase
MGFYPVTPASGEYVTGAPQYPAFTLTLPGGKKLEIEARNISEENKYVQAVTLNGRPLPSFTLAHKDLVQGGRLVFTMTSQPVK